MTTKTELLPHQRSAVDKLAALRIGALYMEMGTGKTRTALELIKMRLNAGKIQRVIWLCPCSVKRNLERDIDKHSDLLNHAGALTICGIETLSSSRRAYDELREIAATADTMIIVDESNLVKNPFAIRSEHIIRIAVLCRYRMILNGTPIAKSIADLYSQWYLLDWRVLGYKSWYSFAANHLEYDKDYPGRLVRTHNIDYIMRKIAPYSYQAKKGEVLTLPEKNYHYAGYYITDEQEWEYNAVYEQMFESLNEFRPETIYRMFSALQAVISGRHVYDNGRHFTTRPAFDDPLDNPRIKKLLDAVSRVDGKAVIYCKYTSEVRDAIKVLTDEYGDGSAVEFTGDVSQRHRQENLDLFRSDALYLVANKVCAGYGLNLEFCHNLIYYSNDWDYATRIQSEDRVHRLGQTEDVHIYDIYARHTLDERIMKCLNRKERLADNFKAGMSKYGKEKMLDWLNGKDHESGD